MPEAVCSTTLPELSVEAMMRRPFVFVGSPVQQADRHYPMPETALAETISRDFADTCGIDFNYMQDLDDAIRPA